MDYLPILETLSNKPSYVFFASIPLFGDWGSIIGTIVVLINLFNILRSKIYQWKNKKFWNPNGKNWLIIKPKYENSMARVEDILASHEIKTILNICKISFIDIYDDKEIINDNNKIYICGPIPNRKSENFCCKYNLVYEIQRDNEGKPYIKDKITGNNIYSPMDIEEPKKNTDLCIVGRINTSNTNVSEIFIFGIHGVGTYGGAKFISSKEFIKKYFRKLKGKNFIFVVKVDFYKIDEISSVSMYKPPCTDSEVIVS